MTTHFPEFNRGIPGRKNLHVGQEEKSKSGYDTPPQGPEEQEPTAVSHTSVSPDAVLGHLNLASSFDRQNIAVQGTMSRFQGRYEKYLRFIENEQLPLSDKAKQYLATRMVDRYLNM